MATASQQCPGLALEVDWSFVDHANYVKLAEDARAAAVANCALLVKSGMLEKKDGLAAHLARSQRAQALFKQHVTTVQLSIDADNRAKAPFELSEAGAGVLRVSFRLNVLDKGTSGWGPAADERYALRVVEEEGMRQVQIVCEQLVQHLPQGTRLEVDWTFAQNDKYRKMKPEERAAVFVSIAKKTLPSGVSDKREGLLGYFAKSSRARQAFSQRVGAVLLRIEFGGSVKPLLMEGGVLALPCLLAAVDEIQPWGTLADAALGLRVQDEVELRKMEAAIEKTGCAGLPVQVDWSFLDDPALLRATAEKRLGVAQAMLSVVQGGLAGKTGLGSLGAVLAQDVDRVLVRAAATVKAKAGVELRFGADRVLEVVVKTAMLTGASQECSSWLPLFQAAKNDGGAAAAVAFPYHLLAPAEENTVCAMSSPPPAANPLLEDAGGAGTTPYHAPPVPLASAGASAPALAQVRPVAPAPVKAASPPPARAAAPPPAKAASPPPVRAAAPPPAKVAAAPAPVKVAVAAAAAPMPVAAAAAAAPDGVPAEFGCPAAWKAACDSVSAINRACGCAAVPEIDWSFLESSQFGALADPTKKQTVANMGVRVFSPLEKELVKLVKRHSLYTQSLAQLQRISFRYDPNESILDMTSGKQGKTHYSVAVLDGGAVLAVALNLSQHMAGIIPALEGKLLVAYGVQHVVAIQEAAQLVAQRGQKSGIECILDGDSFAGHDNFLRQPVTMDSIAWWTQVGKEAEGGLNKLLQAVDLACKDPIFSAAFRSRFSSILVQPDPASSVRDMSAPASWTLLENKDLYQAVFRYNLNDGAQAGQAAGPKLALFVDVRLAQAVDSARKDANEQIIKFKATVPGVDVQITDYLNELR